MNSFTNSSIHPFKDPKLWQRRPIEQEILVPQAVEVGFILPSLMAQMSPLMKEDSSRELMQGQCLQSVEEVAAKFIITFIMYAIKICIMVQDGQTGFPQKLLSV